MKSLRGHGTVDVPVSDPLWLLTLRRVPDRLTALVRRLGFRASDKHPGLWWMRFDPLKPDAHGQAEAARTALRSAGIPGQWRQVKRNNRPYTPSNNGNVVDFSQHQSTPGSYRVKARRRR